jgi:oxygen-independent coproporphyrinogen III oxidase
MKKKLKNLLLNFHSPGRRYSYYPSLPKWESSLNREEILASISSTKVDLYIHIPFCENLCTFCGCNIKVTKDRDQYSSYIDKVIKEWNFYKSHIPNLELSSIYLGGGTPTVLNKEELTTLLSSILDGTKKTSNFLGTVETDPRLPQKEQLVTLSNFGFNSISMGIQDFDEKTLHNVNRVQTPEDVKRTLNDAIEAGFKETSVDLIYGLPFQTKESFKRTVEEVIKLSPTRVCNYPLAKVPWQKGPQDAFGKYEPLSVEEMFDLYLDADELLQSNGYKLLGMGHYSKNKVPHFRNIMGYTTSPTEQLLGLGVSGISNFNGVLFQNEKILDKYLIGDNHIRISHRKTNLEAKLEEVFLDITCRYRFSIEEVVSLGKNGDVFLKSLKYMENNDLIELNEDTCTIKGPGKHFLRTICQTIENYIYN